MMRKYFIKPKGRSAVLVDKEEYEKWLKENQGFEKKIIKKTF